MTIKHKSVAKNAGNGLFNLLPPPVGRLQNTNKELSLRNQTKKRQKHNVNERVKQRSRQGKSYLSLLEKVEQNNGEKGHLKITHNVK